MKKTLLILCIAVAVPAISLAQDRIYRCGNEYTNNATQAKERGCKMVEGGNVTVIQGSRPAGGGSGGGGGASGSSSSASSASPPGAPKVSNNDQKARDSDARAILEAELRKAETKHAELVKEYNGGAPERNALDLRNPQRYMERTAELKAAIGRSESDIAGIKRELSRLPAN
ncbi:DUF4124 domain-containing protein [Acidovorax sp. DW039]|uniref:hypothetical protein n=1 Tax=Acidovorax sp. DW039 TaxID=3095606 RepID=UPI00308ED656|nr:DUF4124 domain-containing protein [Acidovorax sp. DW039]